jgi:hypothetical protein
MNTFLLENLKGRDVMGDLGVGGDNTKTHLKEVEYEDMGRIRLAQGPLTRSSEHGNGPSSSIKRREFFD